MKIQNNFNGFSLIDVHQKANLSDSFEGRRSRVIGNCCKPFNFRISNTFLPSKKVS